MLLSRRVTIRAEAPPEEVEARLSEAIRAGRLGGYLSEGSGVLYLADPKLGALSRAIRSATGSLTSSRVLDRVHMEVTLLREEGPTLLGRVRASFLDQLILSLAGLGLLWLAWDVSSALWGTSEPPAVLRAKAEEMVGAALLMAGMAAWAWARVPDEARQLRQAVEAELAGL
ncbi:MAG: hypothetical protein H6739_31395 [Alphaproteobacteria bacterium]|nr:hypothetical protein [Alphaproteobacteria bacterium]